MSMVLRDSDNSGAGAAQRLKLGYDAPEIYFYNNIIVQTLCLFQNDKKTISVQSNDN